MKRFTAVVTGVMLAVAGAVLADAVGISGKTEVGAGANAGVAAKAPNAKPVVKKAVHKAKRIKHKAVKTIKGKAKRTKANASGNGSVNAGSSKNGANAHSSTNANVNGSAAGNNVGVDTSSEAGVNASK